MSSNTQHWAQAAATHGLQEQANAKGTSKYPWCDDQDVIQWMDARINYTCLIEVLGQNSLQQILSYLGQFLDEAKQHVKETNTVIGVIPGECTKLLQPADAASTFQGTLLGDV